MGFVKSNPKVEEMVEAHATAWERLTDRSYKAVVSRWRSQFEPLAMAEHFSHTGSDAVHSLVLRLPLTGYIFNLPNYKFLPLTADIHDPTYLYFVKGLARIERECLNSVDAIVCDEKMLFSCIFNHEGQWMAHEIYFEADFDDVKERNIIY